MDDNDIRATVEWHFLTRHPPRYLSRPTDIRMYRGMVNDSDEAFPGFAQRLRVAALFAIQFDDPEVVRQGLQCLATVGTADDLVQVQGLSNCADPLVRQDCRTCAFEIKQLK